MRFLPFLLAMVALPSVISFAIPDEVFSFCQSPTIVSETLIGEDGNVEVQALQCANTLTPAETGVDKRQNLPVNVCGATCDTNCFVPSGGGPNPNECHVISDALLFNSQNIGPLFNITTDAALIVMQFRSCLSFFVNQAGIDLTYCRTDWASVLDFVAFNCQAPQNAHGGNCVARNQQWFIQVQHS
ncbi:hypothetical protein BXZ70DRAFT_677274 [Cristinia sonorae]|uniref:Uncharacterized protein n=1 Tax=Cristinia sonorae TaxID=1940300 RepID=A0A8K0UTU0_9AGAR|nr:hypothetical protein BXZ70DRAFT_677274 [Cristinia sonorae]